MKKRGNDDGQAMRILILNQPFHPDVVATAQIAKDLADEMTARGHSVTAIASRSIYGEAGATLPRRETIDGIDIIRVGAGRFGKTSTLGRLVDFAGYYLRAAAQGLRGDRYDVAICLTTPPFIAFVGLLLRAVRGTRVVYWLMDVYPDVMIAHGMIRERGLLHRLLRRLHASVLRRVDATIALGRCMKQRLVEQGAAEAGIDVVPVWSVSDDAPDADQPRPDDSNAYRRQWGVGDRLLVMYSGNFGLAHDVDTFLEAASRMTGDDRIRFAFIGGGKRKPEVERFVETHDLPNCIIEPYQPRERLGELLAAADVQLVTMLDPWWGLVVPSKFYGVAGAARPVIFIGPEESEIARCIDEWSCGARIEPGDVEALVATLGDFAGRRAELNEPGARAADRSREAASRARATGRIIEILESLRRGGATTVAGSTEAAR